MPSVDFMVADIMSLPIDRAAGCDMTFTDPPWEQGLVKMFETMQYKQTGIERPGNDIDDILHRLFELAPMEHPVFIEYSVKGYERVIQAGERVGHVFHDAFPAVQTNGKPYVIVCFNTDLHINFEPQGWQMIELAFKHHNPKRIFEPFAGHGQHTRRFVALGADVVASELNPARAAKLREHFGL